MCKTSLQTNKQRVPVFWPTLYEYISEDDENGVCPVPTDDLKRPYQRRRTALSLSRSLCLGLGCCSRSSESESL